MPTITLGRLGNQWFDITQDGVSQYHAKLTIPTDPNEPWILEDNHSTNGTCIRDDNGQMVRISRVEISPMTFIQLGPNDVTGCSFYATKCEPARQQRPNKHHREFEYIRQELSRFESLCQKEKKIKKWRRWTNRYSWTIYFLLLWLSEQFWANSPRAYLKSMSWVIRFIIPIVMAIITWLINWKSKLSLAKQRMDAIRKCPNPKCLHNLSDQEITNGQCNKCGAQI